MILLLIGIGVAAAWIKHYLLLREDVLAISTSCISASLGLVQLIGHYYNHAEYEQRYVQHTRKIISHLFAIDIDTCWQIS